MTINESELVIADNFVPRSICQQILQEISKGLWAPSPSARQTTDSRLPGRLSSSLIWESDHPALRQIEQSLAATFDLKPNHFEPWQVTRYKRGELYDYHVDAGCWRDHPSGERKRTILIYLEQPGCGGATDFRALHKRVRPIAGRLLLWDNLFSNGKCNYAMIHSSRPVWQGRKTILTTWEHERRFVG